MRDDSSHQSMNNDDRAFATALRALRADDPPADAWARLAARVQRRRRVRRALWVGVPAALAAGIALAVVWPQLQTPAIRPSASTIAPHAAPANTSYPADLVALQASSRQWQAWVATLDANGAPLDGNALATSVALQDRIGLVDLQLSAARNPATTASLWRERIDLLQQLGWLHLEPYAVASRSRADGAAITSM